MQLLYAACGYTHIGVWVNSLQDNITRNVAACQFSSYSSDRWDTMQLQKINTVEALSKLFSGYQGMFGFIGLGVRKNGKLGVKRWVNVRNTEKYFSNFQQHETTDLYVTSNIFKNGFRDVAHHRREESLLSCVNIVIDVDCHNSSTKITTTLLKSFLYDVNDAIKNRLIPPYHMAVYTGRGIQFWYTLKSAFSVCKFLFDAASKELILRYEKVRKQQDNIFKYGLYDDLKIDTTASGRAAGLFRLPGTINTATGTQGEIQLNIGYKLPTINELLTDLGITVVTQKQKNSRFRRSSSRAWLHLQQHRKIVLELLDARKGRREVFCFLYYNSCVQLIDRRIAKKLLFKYNQKLQFPLRDSQILAIIRSVDKVGYYRFKQDRFYEIAQISDEERKAALMKYKLKKQKPPSVRERERKYAEKRKQKAERNDKIIDLALQGKTILEIAKELDIGKNTVNRVTKRGTINDSRKVKKEQQFQRILALINDDKTWQEIAEILRISTRTVARRIAEMKKIGIL